MDEKQIKEKIKLAETSVSALEDQSLKEKAFEVVLSTLLQQPGITKAPGQTIRKPAAVRTKTISTKQPQRDVQRSQLKFDENQLETLKAFYDKFKPTGSELCVFILANFLRLLLKMEEFHEGDLQYCYQQLLNLRPVTSPPPMNLNQIRRTLSWLVAPSRRKQWLEMNQEGVCKVSSPGIIKFNALEIEHESKKSNK